jgi:hypothetical protein
MRQILKLKHWQILSLLLAYEFGLIGLLILTKIELPRIIESLIFGYIPLTVYPFLLGFGFNKYIPTPDLNREKNFKTFVVFGGIWTVLFFVTEILKLTLLTEDNVTDFQLLGIIVATITLFVLFKFLQFPSRTIKSIELKREAGFWEYIAVSFTIFCWPLGIWWIQPRINEISDKNLVTT